ncbi:MAG: hypothetical protein LBJ02_09970 [Bifidobacteriaceae bacterium]|nr:hypothetical protein [Bifidobacteriaceae bacterium]
MRSVVKASAAVIAATLFLAGCSGKPDDSSSPAPLTEVGVTVKTDELPVLTGAYGEAPTIAFPLREGQSSPSPTPEPVPGEGEEAPAEGEETAEGEEAASPPAEGEETASPPESPYIKPPGSIQAQVQPDMAGDGAPIKVDNLASVDLVIWEWGETEPLPGLNTFVSDAPVVLPIRTDNPSMLGLARVIAGHKIGSRVLGVIPPSEGALAAAMGLDEGSTLVVSVDIRDQFSKDSQAQKDAKPTDERIPVKINGELGGPATVTVPADAAPPTGISTVVIATGTGPVIEEGQQILVHYSATDWSGKKDSDTWTEGRGPAPETITADPYGDGSVLSAFSGLIGVPIGSRVLILTPGKDGSYLAVAIVVDIVAIVPGNPDKEEAEAEGAGEETADQKDEQTDE